jgi:hypothetical protein
MRTSAAKNRGNLKSGQHRLDAASAGPVMPIGRLNHKCTSEMIAILDCIKMTCITRGEWQDGWQFFASNERRDLARRQIWGIHIDGGIIIL